MVLKVGRMDGSPGGVKYRMPNTVLIKASEMHVAPWIFPMAVIVVD